MDPKRKTIKELLQLYKLTGILPWKAGRRIDMEEAYKERMKDVARENYAAWGYASPEEAWLDRVNNPTYDYRGYYSDPEFQNANYDAQSHWPDRYKTPAHGTFSDESKYHGVVSDKNPYGLRGGMWIGDKFKPATWLSHLSVPEYRDGKDSGLPTDAILRRQVPLEVQEDPLNMLRTADRLAEVRAKNLTYIGPTTHTPQQLLDYYRDRDLTARFMARKKAVELATDEMMLSLIDPRYVAAGWAVGKGAQWLSSAWKAAKTLTNNYRLARTIKKAVKNTKIEPAKEVPGQVGWAPKTTVEGYHASDAPDLEPDFWFDGWALKRGNAPGFYIAGGEAPEEGFLAKRQHLYDAEATFDKPMVQIGERKVPEGSKNIYRGLLERTVRDMGADGIIYLDIADNQMTHQHIAHVLHPDVNVKVTKRSPKNVQYGEYEAVNDAENTFDITTATRRRGRPVRQPYASTLEVLPVSPFQENKQALLMPNVGADAYVDSKGNVNLRNVVQMVRLIYKNHPEGKPYKNIINSSGNLYEHIRDVVLSAQQAPVPKGYTRQQFVQAALFHDIGKIIDSSYSGHPEASLKLMDELGITASPSVRNAIRVHMKGSDPNNLSKAGSIGEGTPLAMALHFADVVRNTMPMGNAPGEAYYKLRNLLYPTVDDYKIKLQYSWDTDYLLKNIINPILNAYGYKEILLGLPALEARRQLVLRILKHRRTVRGQHGLGDINDPGNRDNLRHAIDQFVAREGRYPTTEELYLQGFEYFKARNTRSGTRGAEAYMHKMELPWKHYMSLYTSNSSEVPMTYRRSSSNPLAISALEMPVLDNPEWSLAELWGYNDYPLTYSDGDWRTLKASDFNSDWRNRILPYVLDNGTKGKPINLNTQQGERDFLDRNRPKFKALAIELYKKIAHTFKDVMPSDIEPSDFMEGYFRNFAISPFEYPTRPLNKPVFESRHFRPIGSGTPAMPSAPVKPQVQGYYIPKKNDYTSFSFGMTPEKLNETILFINKTLRRYGIDTEISPYMYTRLSDKMTVLKYPRALNDLYLKVLEASHNDDQIPPYIKLLKRSSGEPLPPSRQYRHLTAKQIQAHNNANKPKYVDGIDVNLPYFGPDGEAIAANTKYVTSTKSLMQKYIREYFKAIRQARSKDAFVRRAVASYENNVREAQWVEARTSELLDAALKQYRLNRFSIPDYYQHPYPFPLWSRDGYRVFVTEHDEGPGNNRVQNYIFVEKRGKKALKANTKFNFEDTGKQYDHGRDSAGKPYRGLTRNAK